MNQVKEIVFVECDIAHVKRSNPEKNPRRYPEQKREKEWSTEESRIYRPLVFRSIAFLSQVGAHFL